MPKGGVHKRCKFVNTDKFLKDKKCIIRILNNDDFCCARAIVTANAKIDQHEKWESVRKGGKIQEILPNQLHERAGAHHEKCGIDKIKKFLNTSFLATKFLLTPKTISIASSTADPKPKRTFICTSITIITMSLRACLPS